MPTPIAHALGGVTAGCLVGISAALAARTRGLEAWLARLGERRAIAWLAVLGMLPDADLLLGMHRSVVHSAGAALVAAAIGWALAPGARLLTAAVVAAAYGSHLLLDWLGNDPGAPHGIMLWWPWTERFTVAGNPLFMRVCRDYWLIDCWRNNVLALGRELLILGPLTLAVALGAHRVMASRLAVGSGSRFRLSGRI